MSGSASTGPPGGVVLVRHGETAWSAEGRFQGLSDTILSPLGRDQATRAGRALGDRAERLWLGLPESPPSAILHSPLQRAADTARAVSAWFATTPCSVSDDLREISQGAWEGLTHEHVRQRWPREYEAWRSDPTRHIAPDGEPLADAALRADRVLAQSLEVLSLAPPEGIEIGRNQSAPDGPWVVLVAHDGILRLVLLRALGLDLGHYWSFPFRPCGITVLERNEAFRLRLHNGAAHLAATRSTARRRRAGDR